MRRRPAHAFAFALTHGRALDREIARHMGRAQRAAKKAEREAAGRR